MTDTTAPEGYERIEWPEVRAGDVLMHEDGDRLTVTERASGVRVLVAGTEIGRMDVVWARHGYVPYRRKPEMPTVPGAYADKRGVHWLLNTDGGWWGSGFGWRAAEDAAEFAPFTRLVPMPTREQIRKTLRVDDSPQKRVRRTWAAAAVMALLAGDKKETP